MNLPETTSNNFLAGLMRNAVANAPTIPNDRLPRYGMSFLLPLPLFDKTGHKFIGDFNPKGEDGGNTANFNYYPAFTLIAYYGGQTDIPFEKLPIYTDEVITPEPFDFGGFQTNAQKGTNILERSARECALVAQQQFADLGYKEFQSLINYHFNDPDRGLGACQNLIELVLPLENEKFFPKSARFKNGVPFNAPFLDEMDNYLPTVAMKRIMSAELREETRLIVNKLYAEIRDGVSNALKLANRILNETEGEMKNPNGARKGYDEPELRFDDAPVPTDLYCLAHTNRTELDNKQLQASTNIGKELAGSITEAFSQLRGDVPPPTMPKDVMTTEEVQLLLERQRDEMEKSFEEKFERILSAFPPPITDGTPKMPPTVETPADKTPPKGKTK